VTHQQWDIVNTFGFYAQGLVHALSLSESSYCVQI